MIFDVHREAFRLRIERRPLRDGPRHEHTFVLESQVVVQMAGEMLLHAEKSRLPLARRFRRLGVTGGLGRLGKVAFSFVLLKWFCHVFLWPMAYGLWPTAFPILQRVAAKPREPLVEHDHQQ